MENIPKTSKSRSSNRLELVHSDLSGKMPVVSKGGSWYYMTFIENYTRHSQVYMLKRKYVALKCFINWLKMARRQSGSSMKALRSENGGKYVSLEFKQYHSKQGIRHDLTIPDNPWQKGVAERLNRTVIDLVRRTLFHKSLDKSFWAEAVNFAVHVRNRVTTRA